MDTKTAVPEQESHPLGSQVLQMMWEYFATSLSVVERAPKSQRELRILDAGAEFCTTLRRLGFTEAQALEYRSLFIDSLRSYLDQPFREPGAQH